MKKITLCLVLFIIPFLTGCRSDTSGDTYIAETDYQYKQCFSLAYPQLQQGDGIIYLYQNGFIYYL